MLKKNKNSDKALFVYHVCYRGHMVFFLRNGYDNNPIVSSIDLSGFLIMPCSELKI